MPILAAVPLLAMMANGFSDAAKIRQNKIEKDQLDLEEARNKSDMRKAMMGAAASVEPVVNAPADGMGPTATMVGKKAFASDGSTGLNADGTPGNTGAAQAYADTYNSPKARMGRVRDVQAQFDPSGIQQRQVDDFTFDEAKAKHVNAMFDDSLKGLTSHDQVADLVSNHKEDGMGGQFKLKVVPSQDGKKVSYFGVLPDGTMSTKSMEFDNSADGVLQAKAYLSKSMSLGDKLNYMHQQHVEGLQQKQLDSLEQSRRDTDAYHQGMLGIERDKVGVLRDKVANGAAGKASLFERMDEADRLNYQNALKAVQDANSEIMKVKGSGMWKEGSPEASSLMESLVIAQKRADMILSRYGYSTPKLDPHDLRGNAISETDDPNKPTQFQFTGSPEAFRQKLAASANPKRDALLAEFDKQFPQKSKLASMAQMGASRQTSETGDATLNSIRANHIAVLDGMKRAAIQAQDQLAAAAKSGDPVSVKVYAAKLQQARDALASEAAKRLGNGAQAYLAQ